MRNLLEWLLPQNFLPHGHCYLWRPDVLWLHVGSDAGIAASYYAIPVALAYFVHQRRAVLPYWWVPVLFATFIFLCGTTHLLNIWTVWHPDYVVDGMVKLATAVASASTAVLVFASLPRAIALRTPIELQTEVEARTRELNQTFNAAPAGLTRCSRDLRYIAANPAYARIAGLPLQDIVGRPIVEVMGKDGFAAIQPYVERVLAGESVEYESTVPFSNGGKRVLHVTYVPWKEADGAVSGWIASVSDVTARHEAEARLRAAIRHKDEFLAMLAHELRNPLAPISNAGEILARYLDPRPEARETLAILQRQTHHLSRLVDDLLDVERVSQGRLVLDKEAVDIGTVLDQAVETVQSMLQAKSQHLSVHKPPAPVYVSGDVSRLVQCFGNILQNASKYTNNQGEVGVHIAAASGHVSVAVRDSGIGIAAEVLPNIFDLFVQGHRKMDRSDGGLGIGLTVVKKIVDAHGGSVRAESAGAGSGTTVTVQLPTVPAGSERKREVAAVTTPRLRILVVDDNEDAADSLAMVLGLEGHDVATAYHASTALEAVENLKPDVVLLDIGLPGMDGYEVAQRLRDRYGAACPYLVAQTGYGQPADRTRSLASGFDAHLTKPVDLQQLQAAFAAMRHG